VRSLKKDVFHTRFRITENIDYIVKKGDNLYKIAQLYGLAVKELMSANDLTGTTIYPNQTIVIPRKGENNSFYFEEYVIETHDNMELISKKLNTPINLLMKYNDTSKLNLEENQVLRIPRRRASYVVKPEDSLDDILRSNNLTYDEFIGKNLENWLSPGSTIYVR
jgi:LysM repeat protein